MVDQTIYPNAANASGGLCAKRDGGRVLLREIGQSWNGDWRSECCLAVRSRLIESEVNLAVFVLVDLVWQAVAIQVNQLQDGVVVAVIEADLAANREVLVGVCRIESDVDVAAHIVRDRAADRTGAAKSEEIAKWTQQLVVRCARVSG